MMAFVVALAGCAEPAEEPLDISAYIGMNVAEVEKQLPAEYGLVVYDISYPIAGKASRYRTADSGREEDWMVVAACGDEQNIALAVLNVDDYTDENARAARAGEFDSLLVECGTSG